MYAKFIDGKAQNTVSDRYVKELTVEEKVTHPLIAIYALLNML